MSERKNLVLLFGFVVAVSLISSAVTAMLLSITAGFNLIW